MPLYLTILSLLIPVIAPHAATPALILPAHVQHTIPALTYPVAVLPALIFLGTRAHAPVTVIHIITLETVGIRHRIMVNQFLLLLPPTIRRDPAVQIVGITVALPLVADAPPITPALVVHSVVRTSIIALLAITTITT